MSFPTRYTVLQTAQGLSISMPARKQVFQLVFISCWLVLWTYGWLAVVHELLFAPQAELFLLFWLVPWTLGGLFAAYTVLWQLFGRERLTLQPGSLQYSLMLLGIGKTRRFDTLLIEDWRLRPAAVFSGQPGIRVPNIFGSNEQGSLAFDYQGRTVIIGVLFDEAEAKAVSKLLAAYLPAARNPAALP